MSAQPHTLSKPVGARTHLEHRDAIMASDELQALPRKVKLLVGIGVAAALQSSMCVFQWAKLAREAGVTDAEMTEAILVSRFMKAATVNDTATEALHWLQQNPADAENL